MKPEKAASVASTERREKTDVFIVVMVTYEGRSVDAAPPIQTRRPDVRERATAAHLSSLTNPSPDTLHRLARHVAEFAFPRARDKRVSAALEQEVRAGL